MKKARMASSQYIKCGDPNHIKKDYTNGWKSTKEETKKTEKGKEKAAKVSAITATVDICKWGPKVFRVEYYPEVILQNF